VTLSIGEPPLPLEPPANDEVHEAELVTVEEVSDDDPSS
jgi:hypothetical protein